MTYKTLLVHIDDSLHTNERVDFAFDLARRYDAHLIGLYVLDEEQRLLPISREDFTRLAEYEALHVERRERAHEVFLEAARREGASAVEWRAPDGPAVDVATLHARHADLLVFGQYDPRELGAYAARHFVEDVVLGAGVPAVVVPHAARITSLGDKAFVAWNGSREAARALTDALPLLKAAGFVDVVRVDENERDSQPEGVDLCAWLDRHEVHASYSRIAHEEGVSVGATLLGKATETGADFVVLGAYGHLRLLERILGGVTRTMLESMMLPIFMSH